MALGKSALEREIRGPLTHERLATVVSNRQLASWDQLRGHGLNGEMDQMLSAQFIVNSTYGSRATTTLWRDARGTTQWREVSFSPQGNAVSMVEETLPRE